MIYSALVGLGLGILACVLLVLLLMPRLRGMNRGRKPPPGAQETVLRRSTKRD